jgi:hypothetical protein
LNPNQKSEAVSFLVRKKSMGRLSHIVIDITVLAVIVGMFVLCISNSDYRKFPDHYRAF